MPRRLPRELPVALMAFICGYWDGEKWRIQGGGPEFGNPVYNDLYVRGYRRALLDFAKEAEVTRPELEGLTSELLLRLDGGIVNPKSPPTVEGTILKEEL